MPGAESAMQLAKHLSSSLADGSFIRLVLSRPKRGPDNPEKILARCVELKNTAHLSFTFRFPAKDVTKNMPLPDGIKWAQGQFGREFRSALLCTTHRDWQFSISDSGQCRIIEHKPSITIAPSRAHDQSHTEILDSTSNDWLFRLGVTDAGGKVRERMADKHRQINRYLEIFAHLANDCGWRLERKKGSQTVKETQTALAPELAPTHSKKDELVIADMGSGKGYLTFGVWHLFRRAWRMPVRVIGVDEREELATATSNIAHEIKAEGLEFLAGSIDAISLPKVDALIALHACNTATDHAILRGIELGARLILTAPCCHKELRPQLKHPTSLAPVLRHGLMEERMAEWVTDGLRALFLEWAGYRTKIFEFVSVEHTAKNLMISAIRENLPFTTLEARDRIIELKSFFGIAQTPLDALLDQPFAAA